MLCPGLSLVGLICTVTVVLLIEGSWGKEMSLKNWRPSSAVRHQQDLHLKKLCDGVCISENQGKRKRCRKPPHWIQDLNRVTLKLRIIIGKYDQKREHLNELYKAVANCGLSNCGKNPVLPEKMKPNEFNCEKFKKLGDLKKRTSILLSKGYNGSKTYEDLFEELIRFEKSLRFQQQRNNNGSRLTILKELQSEIKVLSLNICEVKLIKTKKRLKTCESARKNASGALQIPKFQTDLKIIEWGILQQSKEYLSLLCESLQLVCKCWKGRKWGSKHFPKREQTEVLGLDKEMWRYQRAEKIKNGNY